MAADADATMRAQIEYWKTHKAKTAAEEQQKVAAYQYANDHGIKGARWPDASELRLAPSNVGGTNWDNLGAGLSTLAVGAAGIAGGPAAALAAGAAAAPVIANSINYDSHFGEGGDIPAASYLPGTAPGAPIAPNSGGGGGTVASAQWNPGTPGVKKGDPANGYWDALVPEAGIPAVPGSLTGSSGNPFLDALLAQTKETSAKNDAVVNGTVKPAIDAQSKLNGVINGSLGSNLGDEMSLIGGYQTANNGLITQGNDARDQFIGQNDAALKQYQDTMGGFSQLAATPYQGDWTSNAADVGRESSSYDQLSGIAGGSLNYSAAQAALSQAGYTTAGLTQYQTVQAAAQLAQLQQAGWKSADLSTASSNPEDVANEQQALGQFKNIAGGSLDVTNGAASPEAYQAQLSALSQMSDLTHPERTSQEEFLYEQQRLQEEQQQRSSRAAVMQNLRARGMSGSGLELTNQLGADQITSQNRLLGDLGTQATAVARAQAALGNYGNLSSTMVGQGNQVAESNANNRLQGATGQGSLASNMRGQSDAMNMFNTGQTNQNNMFNADAYNSNQQFNTGQANQMSEFNADAMNQNNMFNAGQTNTARYYNAQMANQNSMFNADAYNQNQLVNMTAANQNSQFNAGQQNNASANNQATMVQGATNAGTLASNMRTQSDAVGLANKAQLGISNRAADTFAADQQDKAAGRAGDLITHTQGTAKDDLGAKTNAISAASTLGDKNLGAGLTGIQDTNNYWAGLGTRGQQDVSNALGYGTLATGVNVQGGSAASDALTKAAGDYAAKLASGSLSSPYKPYG